MGPLIEVGYVARAHGIAGEVRVVPHDSQSTVLLDADEVVIDGRCFRVDRARRGSGGFLLRLEGIDGRDSAEGLRGGTVEVARELVPIEDGEVLLIDLVGCAVFTTGGEAYGEVVAIDVGPQDRLVIHQGDIERLLPLVPEFVVDIDLENQRIEVEPPEDLPESQVERRR